jgi:hypothetical protein
VKIVKLNFHMCATLACNLNSGLCLELQAYANLASRKDFTSTLLPQSFPTGGFYASYPRYFMSLIRAPNFYGL